MKIARNYQLLRWEMFKSSWKCCIVYNFHRGALNFQMRLPYFREYFPTFDSFLPWIVSELFEETIHFWLWPWSRYLFEFPDEIIDFGSQCSDEYRQALKRSFPDSLPFHSQKNLNDPLKKLGQNYQIWIC